MIEWNSPEDAFAELDRFKEQQNDSIAKALGRYRKELIAEGFSRREAIRLVQYHVKFLYELSIQDKMSKDADDRLGKWVDNDDDLDH